MDARYAEVAKPHLADPRLLASQRAREPAQILACTGTPDAAGAGFR